MPACAFYGCSNYTRKTKGTGIRYFSFPKVEEFKQRWINACKRSDCFNVANSYVCSVHFKESDFYIPLRHRLLNYSPKNARTLKADAVPYNPVCKSLKRPMVDVSGRTARAAKRRQRTIINDALLSHKVQSQQEESEEIPQSITNIEETDTDSKNQVTREVSCCSILPEIERNSKAALQEEIAEWKKKCENLLEENLRLKEELKKNKSEVPNVKALERIFTPGQIKLLLTPSKKKIHWSPDDIASAISLRSVSPKAYRFLRNNKFPLPGLSTLRDWARCLHLDRGLLSDVMRLLKVKANELSELDRLTVLTFDEVYVSNKVCIDPEMQQVIGPHKACQTVMARGLLNKWKQPVYYDFDQNMTKEIMFNIISQLHFSGFIVVAITSDMGSGNVGFWSEINIGHGKDVYFPHPADENLRVHVFADIPHLLKLLRNHFLDQGFIVNNVKLDKTCLEKLLQLSNSDLTIAFKLSQYHLDVRGTERQKVRPAAQIFSNQNSKAIEWCGMSSDVMEGTPWEECAQLLKLINDWFDLFNAQTKYGSHQGANAFGVNFDEQINLLDRVTNYISSMRVGAHKNLIQFQKGILLSNTSLVSLYKYLQEMFQIEYILTYRLNQDVLENFFSYIRGMGGANDHPSPLDIKYRLRWYILGKHSATAFTLNKNTEESAEEQCLLKPLESEDEVCFSGSLLKNVAQVVPDENVATDEVQIPYSFIEPEYSECVDSNSISEEIPCEYQDLLTQFELFNFKDTVHSEGLKYIAGYVAFRFRNKYSLGTPCDMAIKDNMPDWIQHITRGSLLHPNSTLMNAATILEKEFNTMHGALLSKEKFIFNILTEKTCEKLKDKIEHEVIHCLARTRTYIRLREINKKISFQNAQKRLDRKMRKFTNNKK